MHFVHAQDEVAEGIFADAARLNEALASALASGAAWPFPDEEKGRPIRWRPACDVCEFSLACRRDHGPTRERLARAGVWARLKEALAGDGDETDE